MATVWMCEAARRQPGDGRDEGRGIGLDGCEREECAQWLLLIQGAGGRRLTS
jgi:hypothetical protein